MSRLIIKKCSIGRSRWHWPIAGLVLLGARPALALVSFEDKAAVKKTAVKAQDDPEGARRAFLAAYKVFMHPRCMNCHPSGDAPLQGEDSHIHGQNVKRGKDGTGKYALRCSNCHQDKHVAGENMPPGNPNWRLPSPEAPLIFQGRSPAALASQLKDPSRNGGKTLEQILHHVAEDKLVLGCWEPGEGRAKPPLSHGDFVREVQAWIEKGAHVPPP